MNLSDYNVPQEDKIPFIKFMAYVANIDKTITSEEKQVLDSIAIAWNLSSDDMKQVDDVIERGSSIQELASEFKNKKTPYLLIQELITLAGIDGQYADFEKKAIRDIAAAFFISEKRIQELEDWVQEGIAWRDKGIRLITPEGE